MTRLRTAAAAVWLAVLAAHTPFAASAQPTSSSTSSTSGTSTASTAADPDSLPSVPFPDPVVVTATRMPIKASQTARVVTLLDRRTLQAWPASRLSEVLNGLGGLHLNGASGAPGTNPSLFLRGAGSGQVLVLLDGVPVSDASRIDNSFDLNHLDAASVERIEILRGAQSTLWGSDAIAGVINVVTRPAEGVRAARPRLSVSYGQYASPRIDGGVSGTLGRTRYRLSGGYDRSRGFSAAIDSLGGRGFDPDGWTSGSLSAGLARRFGDATTWDLSARWSRYRTDLDAGAYADDRDMDARNRQRVLRSSLDHVGAGWRGRVVQTLTYTERRIDDDSTHVGGFNLWSEDRYKGWTAVTDAYATTEPADGLTLLAGAQAMWQATAQSYRSVSAFGPYQSTPLGRDSVRARNVSFYASARWEPASRPPGALRFQTEAGARVNLHSLYGRAATFTINPSLHFSAPDIRVFANLGSGYKIPSLYQLHSEYGNRSLRPEKSLNLDLGADWHSPDRSAYVRAVVFRRWVEQLITFVTPPDSWSGRYVNRDRQNDLGAELEAGAQIHPALRLTGSLSWVKGHGLVDGERVENLYRRPERAARIDLAWAPRSGAFEGFALRPSVRLVGERLNGPFDPGPRMLPAYQVADLSAMHRLSPNMDVFAEVRNLGDRSWVEIAGYAVQGRAARLGIRMAW